MTSQRPVSGRPWKVPSLLTERGVPRWIAMVPALAAVLSGCVASAGDAEGLEGQPPSATTAGEEETIGQSQDAIIRGSQKAGDLNAVLYLRIQDSKLHHTAYCTGTLVAPNVVLTARHCVSVYQNSGSMSCDEKGKSLNGTHFTANVSASSITVHLGAAPTASPPVAMARIVYRPGGDIVCDTDIALIILDRSITGIAPLPVRLSRGPYRGEKLKVIGYGQTEQGSGGQRIGRNNVPVLEVGPKVSASQSAVGPREFELGQSVCHGDSGGPAISEATGAVVGVVSRGTDNCEADYGQIFTTTAGFENLFEQAFQAAGAKVQEEANTPSSPEEATRTTRLNSAQGTRSSSNGSTTASSCSASPYPAQGVSAVASGWAALTAGLLGLRRRRRNS